MRTSGKLALSAIVGIGAVGLGSPVFAQSERMRDNVTKTAIAKSDSDADKTIARAKMVTKIVEEILVDWSFSAIRGEQRKTVIHNIFDVLRQEKWTPFSGGKAKLTAKVSMSEVRNRILDALDVQNTFGADQCVIVVHPDVCKVPGLDADEQRALYAALMAGVSDYLNQHRFREAPAMGQKDQMMKAALELGANATTQKMHEFSAAFAAPIVVTVPEGKIKLEKAAGAQAQLYKGYLRCMGIRAKVYDKNTDTILGQFTMSSSENKQNETEATAEELHQPWVGKEESTSAVSERYAKIVGWYLAANICKRLFDRFYAMQPVPQPPAGAPAPRDCPGCGDKVVDPALNACPACESPLPAAKGGAAAGGTPANGKRVPTARDYYQLRFKDWDEAEVDGIMEALKGNTDFGNWKSAGTVGIFKVYRCSYVGGDIEKAIKDGLHETEYYDQMKLSQTGNNFNILKKK
ncbi:MAG: hypothetical protein AB7N76_08025 [Planctomycetota bacterium]